jgi:hypothetical protein
VLLADQAHVAVFGGVRQGEAPIALCPTVGRVQWARQPAASRTLGSIGGSRTVSNLRPPPPVLLRSSRTPAVLGSSKHSSLALPRGRGHATGEHMAEDLRDVPATVGGQCGRRSSAAVEGGGVAVDVGGRCG